MEHNRIISYLCKTRTCKIKAQWTTCNNFARNSLEFDVHNEPSDLTLFNLNLLNLAQFDFVRFAFLKEKGNRKEPYTNQLYYVILNYQCIIIL